MSDSACPPEVEVPRVIKTSRGAGFTLLAILLGATAAQGASAAALVVSPAEIALPDLFARQQVLVEHQGRDVTHEATYRVEQSAIAGVDRAGHVAPLATGQTQLHIEFAGQRATLAVRVADAGPKPVDFANQIVPILSKHGCNAGGCHGKASGQNGFRLSLFGFDAAYDYAALVKDSRGRRIFPAAPEQSLLLLKAINAVPHGGGQRLDPKGESYQLMRRWIAAGAPASSPDAPRVVKLHVTPAEPGGRILQRSARQQLAVTAEYSDGSRRDVTRQSEFASNLDPVAAVNDDGLVRSVGQSGEAAILVRYMGRIAVFRAIVPHGKPLTEIPGFKPNNYIDELSANKWKKLGLLPSPTSDDATFLRRVTIDLCGRLPTADEARAFLSDSPPATGGQGGAGGWLGELKERTPGEAAGATLPPPLPQREGSQDKRSRAIDRLLESPDYPAYFAMRFGAILRNSNLAGADQAAYAFHNWIKDIIARNRPYDELVRGVVAASGEWQDAPAINWYWQTRDDQLHSVTADTAQVFLGMRLQCARCHHHPYERWGQEDYYGLAGFFTRLGRKSFGEPPPYFASAVVTTSEKNPLTGKVPEPKYLDGEFGKFTPEDDPRHGLVDWMARPDNPFFARALVNRLWGHFYGRGLVHEVDDLRESNPPSNPELLDALAKDFIAHKFDMKHMVRTMVNSRVYQLSSEPIEQNKDDRQNFARFYARRLIAEVFLDAVDQATGVKTEFNNLSKTARAIDLPHEGFGSYFLDTFDRPKRVSGCECERSSGATLSQVLLLANSDEIENKLSNGKGRVATLFNAKKPVAEIVEDFYLSTLGRKPSQAEAQTNLSYLETQQDKQKALEDVMWTLLNTKEFMFNH